jgi:membrane-associated phospholipid phosphatase/protein tyrosine/serine phosphatase
MISTSLPTAPSAGASRRKWLRRAFCVLLPLYGFGWLIEAVWNRNGLSCDVPILNFIHRCASPTRDTLMVWMTHAGGVKTAIFLAALTVIVLLRKPTRRDALFLACAVGGALLLDLFIKNAVHRVRPHLWTSPAPEFDFSFPSGHSTGTMSFIVALVVIAWRTRWRWAVLFGGACYVAAIGFSRLYLGVHYPSDVLGGWLLALAWVGGISGLRRMTGKQPVWATAALRFGGGLAAGLVLVLAGYVSSDLAHDNLRVAVAGRAYRSGQMDAEEFTSVIERYHIKSIVNLRGENPGTAWHQAEIETARKLAVTHYDWGFGSGDELTLKRMDALVALLRRAPKPVLIHCEGGADRSGLASALYCFAIAGQKAEVADRQLSLWNGHVPFIRPKVTAMDDSFRRYATNDTHQVKQETSSTK